MPAGSGADSWMLDLPMTTVGMVLVFQEAPELVSIKLNYSCWGSYQVAASKKSNTVLFQKTMGHFFSIYWGIATAPCNKSVLFLLLLLCSKLEYSSLSVQLLWTMLFFQHMRIVLLSLSEKRRRWYNPWLSLKWNCVKFLCLGRKIWILSQNVVCFCI